MSLFSKHSLGLIDSFRIRLERLRINYDENEISSYSLPNPLNLVDGCIVTRPNEWWEKRRPEILRMFQNSVYGRNPQNYNVKQNYQISIDASALSGLATRKEITIVFNNQLDGPRIHLLLYVPNDVSMPVPAFLGLNFYGNHTIHKDPGISIIKQWQPQKRNTAPRYILPPDESRGKQYRRWPVEEILQHGYALATAYYGELEPDFSEGYRYGVRSIFLNQTQHKEILLSTQEKQINIRKSKENKNIPVWDPVNDWGSIGAWAWGLSRIMDYLECDPDILESQIILFGHSRLGKAALWAGAQDDRFAIVISNNSGCGGAALYRRCFGETVKLLNLVRPHWFSKKFKNF